MSDNNNTFKKFTLPPQMVQKLRDSAKDLDILETHVRNMERALLPGAIKARERLTELRKQINAMTLVYG